MESVAGIQNDLPTDTIQLFNKTNEQALEKNAELSQEWTKKHSEYVTLLSFLETLPNTLTCDVMVPIGKKALMRGKIVHTNEILVNLGDGWFVKQSAKLASEICIRRMKMCSEMLSNLEKEYNLLNSRSSLLSEHAEFGQEIREPYNEEEEAQWRVSHREKEKSHRQELRHLRNQSSENIEIPTPTDDDLWNKLEQLELQEELELELERLNAKRANSIQFSSKSKSPANPTSAVSTPLTNILDGPEMSNEVQKPKRRVSFADVNEVSLFNESNEDSDNEPCVIEFSHSPVEPTEKSSNNGECSIENPSDIYKLFPKTIKKSILKQVHQKGSGVPKKTALKSPVASDVPVTVVLDDVANRKNGVVLRDVMERVTEQPVVYVEPSRPVSRFKAARMAAAQTSSET